MAADEIVINSEENSTPSQQTLRPKSRGVPSKESLWLDDIRKRRDEWKYHKKVRLELEQILRLVFPPEYQAKYYDVALNFMKLLLSKGTIKGQDAGEFIRVNGFSKATFYNVILPRLKRVGMVRLEREEFNQLESKQKYYRKIIQPSKQFSMFFSKLAEEYDSIVDTAEANRPSEDQNSV